MHTQDKSSSARQAGIEASKGAESATPQKPSTDKASAEKNAPSTKPQQQLKPVESTAQ